jgi:hypothetical protein
VKNLSSPSVWPPPRCRGRRFRGSAVGQVQAVLNAMSESQRAGFRMVLIDVVTLDSPHVFPIRIWEEAERVDPSDVPRTSARSGATTRSSSSCVRTQTAPTRRSHMTPTAGS